MAFADLWQYHPRDVDQMTLAEFDRFKGIADKRLEEARRAAKVS